MQIAKLAKISQTPKEQLVKYKGGIVTNLQITNYKIGNDFSFVKVASLQNTKEKT